MVKIVKKNNNLKTILALMLVLFIDGIGQSIIFPVLMTTVVNQDSSLFFSADVSQSTRNMWYGILVCIYFFTWFISAPIIGDWSDRVGRKRVLLICLILALISFFLSAISFKINSLLLLFFARFLGGISSGNQAIAKASVIDLCDPDKKSIYFGWMLFPVTLGLALGPVIGAALQDSDICRWFNLKTPFYFVSAITFLNIILLLKLFKETGEKKNVKIKLLKSIKLFRDAFATPKIRILSLTYLLTHTGWAMFYIYLPDYIIRKLHISAFQASISLGVVGFGMGVGLSILPSLLKRVIYSRVVICGYLGLLLGNFMLVITNNFIVTLIISFFTSVSFGTAVANILPLFSNAVDSKRQGWVMGIVGSIIALTAGLSALFLAPLVTIDISAPYLFSIMVIAIGIFVFFRYKNAEPLNR